MSVRSKLLALVYVTHFWEPMREETEILARSMRELVRANPDYFRKSKVDDEYPVLWVSYAKNVIPELHVVFRVYHSLSTIVHLLNLVLSSILILNREKDGRLTSSQDSISCYIPRFTPYEVMSQQSLVWFGALFSALHLSWRVITRVIKHQMRFDLIPFLLLNERLISIAQSEHQTSRAFAKLGTLDVVQSILINRVPDSFAIVKNQIEPRSNRSLAARESLIKLLHKYFLIAFVALSLTVPLIVFFGTRAIYFRHEIIYDGCLVTYLDSLYWYRSLSSYIIAGDIFIDSILAVFFPPILARLLVEDLFIYWSHIQESINRLVRLVDQYRLAQCDVNSLEHYRIANSTDSSKYWKVEVQNLATVELEIMILLPKIEDFFKQLSRINKFVSIFLSYVLTIWLATNGIMTLTGVQLSTSEGSLIIRSVQVSGFLIMVVLCAAILKMKSSTEPAYKILCTLIAVSNSLDKVRWMQTLDAYVEGRYGFTLVHSKLFTTVMLFRIISYTFTVIIIVKCIQN